jgi:hypothetical protein
MKTIKIRTLLVSIFLLSLLSQPLLAKPSQPIIVVIWGHGFNPCRGLGICEVFIPDRGPHCPTVEMTAVVKSDTDIVFTVLNPPQPQGQDNNFVVDNDWPLPSPEVYGYKSITILKGNYRFDWGTKQVTVKFQGERDPNTLFSDLGSPRNVYNRADGWRVSGANSQTGMSFTTASQFQPANSGTVSQIDVAVTYVSGVNSFNVALYSDNGGLPGTVLSQWNSLSSSTNFGGCCGMVTISGITGISLTAGTDYWLVIEPASPDSTTWETWNLNTVRLSGGVLYSNDNGRSWNGSGQEVLGAFDILGSPISGSPSQQ